MSPMNPRLMRPIASRATLPPYEPVAYTRLWAVTTQSGGDIEGSAESDTGYYAVRWWDNTVDVYDSGDPFSKPAAGNQRVFEIYPSDASGDPSGGFEGFDVSGNALTQLRADNVTLDFTGGYYAPGFYTYSLTTYGGFSVYVPGPYIPPGFHPGRLENNLLAADALDQFYTDLFPGVGYLSVEGNPGIDADDPTIATDKGYTVFGSVPPLVAALLNFEQATVVDLSPAGRSVTVRGNAALSTAEKKYGDKSLYCDGNGDGITIDHETTDGFAANSDNWTIEMWAYPLSEHDGALCIISNSSFNMPGFQLYLTSAGEIVANNASFAAFAGGSYTTNEWQHFAAVRNGGTIAIYRNGVSQGTTTQVPDGDGTAIAFGFSTAPFGNRFFHGYLDEIRYTRGAALYTSNFTPPGAHPIP